MLHSFFVVTRDGEVFMEKHWRSTVPRTIVDDFWAAEVAKFSSMNELPPVLSYGKYFFVPVLKEDVVLLGVLDSDGQVSATIALLDRIAEVWKFYFDNAVCESAIKDHFAAAYCVLEEMVDYGIPTVTEPSLLIDLVPPPTVVNKLKGLRDRIADQSGASSSTKFSDDVTRSLGAHISADQPWRRRGVKHKQNDLLIDVLEEVDAIVDVNGATLDSRISGRLRVRSLLSDHPRVTVSFRNLDILEDFAFHPCVSVKHFEADRSLQFTPPDGEFILMSYRAPGPSTFPFYVKPSVTVEKGEREGKMNIMVGTTPSSRVSDGVVENVVINARLPVSATGILATSTAQDTRRHVYPASRTSVGCPVSRWEIPKLVTMRSVTLNARFNLSAEEDYNPVITVNFRLPRVSLSGPCVPFQRWLMVQGGS